VILFAVNKVCNLTCKFQQRIEKCVLFTKLMPEIKGFILNEITYLSSVMLPDLGTLSSPSQRMM
jgi:hypothetical protein